MSPKPKFIIILLFLLIVSILTFFVILGRTPIFAQKINIFYASKSIVKTGEPFYISASISHTKELGMVYLLKSSAVINQSSACNGLKTCVVNFSVTENTPGTYQYYITALAKTGRTSASSNYITVTVSGTEKNKSSASAVGNACKIEQKIGGYTIIWEDSDCGKNYEKYGEIKYTVKESNYQLIGTYDRCSTQPLAPNYLVEYYLKPIGPDNPYNVLQAETYYCPGGCANGACLNRLSAGTELPPTNEKPLSTTAQNFCDAIKNKYTADLANEALNLYDENEDGYISSDELAAALDYLKDNLTEEGENKQLEFLKEYSQNNCKITELLELDNASDTNQSQTGTNNFQTVIDLDPNDQQFCAKVYTLDRIANSKGNLSSVNKWLTTKTYAKNFLQQAGWTSSQAVNNIITELAKSQIYNYFNDYSDKLTYSASCELDAKMPGLKSQFKQKCNLSTSLIGSRFCRTIKQGRNINVKKLSPEGMSIILNNLANLSDAKKRKLDHFIKVAAKYNTLAACSIKPQFLDRNWIKSLYAIKQDLTWIWSPSFGSVGGHAGGTAEGLIQGKTGNWFALLLDLHGGAGSTDYKALAALAQAGIFKASEIKELIQWHFEKLYKPLKIVYYYSFIGSGRLVKYLTLKPENIGFRAGALERALSLLKTNTDCPSALSIKPLWNALKTFEPPSAIPKVPAASGLPSEPPGYPEFLKDTDKTGYFDIRNVLFSTAGTKGRITPLSEFGY